MAESEKLDHEVRTSVTKTTAETLEAIARERGEGVKVTQLVREALRDFIAKHQPKKGK